jgi:protein translocase subunit yidC
MEFVHCVSAFLADRKNSRLVWWWLGIRDGHYFNYDSDPYDHFTADGQPNEEYPGNAVHTTGTGKIKKKYSSKDAVTQEKLRQEQMLLLQKYNINPLAGCLPLLIQMPILIGFYHAIVRTEAIKGNSFLWFELAKPDPYFLLPLIAGLTTFLQQKILMKGQPANPQSQMMLWVMPVLILMFALYLPSALPLYWIIGNLFSIVQSYFIKLPELEESGARNATLKGSGGKKR